MLRAYIKHPVTGVENEYAARLRPDKKFEVGAKASNGEADQGDFLLDDPLGTLDWLVEFAGRRRVRITEDASGSEKTIIVGRIASKDFDRGTFRGGRGRELSISVEDANSDLAGIIVHGFARPDETGRARVLATLAAYCNGTSSTALNPLGGIYGRASTVIGSTYVQDAGNVVMPAETYDATDPLSVLRACAEFEDKRLGVYIEDDGSLELYYAPRAETTQLNCTLNVSDDPADVDRVTTFAPNWINGPALHTDTDETLTGILLVHPDGTTFERRPAAEAIRDRWEAAVYSTKGAGTGTQEASTLLDARDEEQPRRQFTLRLPADKVHLVKACMRIEVLQAVASAVDTPTFFRIVGVRYAYLSPDEDENQYNVVVTLETPIKLGQRWPRGKPAVPPAPASQHFGPCAVPTCSETFQRTSLPGDEGGISEILGIAWAESWTGAGPATYVTPSQMVIPPPDASATPAAITHHNQVLDFGSLTLPVETLELVRLTIPAGGASLSGPGLRMLSSINSASNSSEWEWNFGAGLFEDMLGTQVTIVANLRNSIGGLTSDGFVIPGALEQNHKLWVRRRCEAPKTLKLKAWWYGNVEPDAWEVTVVGSDPSFDSTDPARLKYRTSAIGTSSYGGTISPISICFVDGASCSDGTCSTCLPQGGNFVGQRLVGFGDDVTVTWSVPGAYVPGSLTVWVDGLLQDATETDPTTGTFTLSFAPVSDHGDGTPELIEASWRQA